jgi:hypothetical protein
VAWIGLKLVVGGLHSGDYWGSEIPAWLFWSVMVIIVVFGLVVDPEKSKAKVGDGESGQTQDEPSPPENGQVEGSSETSKRIEP